MEGSFTMEHVASNLHPRLQLGSTIVFETNCLVFAHRHITRSFVDTASGLRGVEIGWSEEESLAWFQFESRLFPTRGCTRRSGMICTLDPRCPAPCPLHTPLHLRVDVVGVGFSPCSEMNWVEMRVLWWSRSGFPHSPIRTPSSGPTRDAASIVSELTASTYDVDAAPPAAMAADGK